MEAEIKSRTRALTFINDQSGATITWSEDSDDFMEKVIQRHMDNGATFFIIDPRCDNAAPASGAIKVVETPNRAARIRRRAASSKEVARSESVALLGDNRTLPRRESN